MNKNFCLICLLLPMFFSESISGSLTEPADTVVSTANTDTVTNSARMLDELVVSQKLVSHVGNTDTYLVTKKMLKDVHDTGELLGKIDGAFYNPL